MKGTAGNMRGITITDIDERGVLSVSLHDLLLLLEPMIRDSVWTCHNVEATGTTAGDLHRLCNKLSQIDSQALTRLAAGADQVIDGDFRAFRPHRPQPWLIIRAVDSSAYDVETDDLSLLDTLRCKFRTVLDIPQ